mgnify:CR=1 FL=1
MSTWLSLCAPTHASSPLQYGYTALHQAAAGNGDSTTVKVLLAAGADPNRANKARETALPKARPHNREEAAPATPHPHPPIPTHMRIRYASRIPTSPSSVDVAANDRRIYIYIYIYAKGGYWYPPFI